MQDNAGKSTVRHCKTNFRNVTALLGWYHTFGLFHELAHLYSAWLLSLWKPEGGAMHFLSIGFKALLGRTCDITTDSIIPINDSRAIINNDLVRHAGWAASLGIALLIGYWSRRTSSKQMEDRAELMAFSRVMSICAWVTFFEAFCTDFLGIGVIAGKSHLLFCGNFGLVLINSAWVDQDYGRKALKMLEQMVHITMMRGAQSGGVIAWAVDTEDSMKAKGIRSRVVNGKRTDLSKAVREKVIADSFMFGKIRPGIQTFLGHTRFATSSMATFDGTHPHQWTPPQKRRVYQMTSSSVLNSSSPMPQNNVVVENFITHNGDFDFYTVNGVQYGLTTIQEWLFLATGTPPPSAVDSISIAGMIDLLRTKGCFGLSVRYAILLGCESSKMETGVELPSYAVFEQLGTVFEHALTTICEQACTTLSEIGASPTLRQQFALEVVDILMKTDTVASISVALTSLISVDEESSGGVSLQEMATRTIDAFFDNDLFQSTRIFMSNAKGSFGLMVTSSLDAKRQICLAARGQPISLAFYPKEGLVFYGSELASVKVGLDIDIPSSVTYNNPAQMTIRDVDDRDNEIVVKHISRHDLDDLGGEVVLLDWGCGPKGNAVQVLVHQESRTAHSRIESRLTLLENNEFIRSLTLETRDPVADDIRDIPRVCKHIQDNWKEAGLNRYTAFNLIKKIKQRLTSRMRGDVPTHCNSIDILLTGCETSLWLAEQFASDLTKAFCRLNVKAVSSNKLLGIFGQDMVMPAVGYPMSDNISDLKGAVVIIVSHSGQTFAPLACSSLLQSFTSDIFLVSSEWDTQIGRQLREISRRQQQSFHTVGLKSDIGLVLSSRIFTTDIGVRPAEPCSVSVVAIQQLLTQLFIHISISLIGSSEMRTFCGAIVTESDLMILERCNQESISALECIVGSNRNGARSSSAGTHTERELRQSGDIWSEHVLENPKAYILTFLYVVGTVLAGYPLITGVAIAAGLADGWAFFICRFFDGLLYFFFHQLAVFTLRLIQGRNLRHRTTGRTVVIGDCPWVSQSIDAFLSKLFACSYPIASINVLSGNPADHLVHRHTHRVVRGTLLICGRPDGRLSALTNAEVSVCLSVNQASSIQNIGGRCESITIGHNPSPMAATSRDIFLSNHRPLFLCERVADDLEQAIKESEQLYIKPMRKLPSFILGKKPTRIDLSKHSQHIVDLSKHSCNIMDLSKHSHNIIDSNMYSSLRGDQKIIEGGGGILRDKHADGSVTGDDEIMRDANSIDRRDLGQSGNFQKARSENWANEIPRQHWRKWNSTGNQSQQPLDQSSEYTENIDCSSISRYSRVFRRKSTTPMVQDESTFTRIGRPRSSLETKGLYATFEILAQAEAERISSSHTVQTFANDLEQSVVDEMLKERQGLHLSRRLFEALDPNKTGFIAVDKFVASYLAGNGELSEQRVRRVIKELGIGLDNGLISFDDFVRLSQMPEVEVIRKLQISAPRNEKGLLLVQPSKEEYFGQDLQYSAGVSGFEAFTLAKTQHFAMEMYESRIASLERFVAMCVMFHQMGSRVQCFFEKISFGFLGYRMDRTHSIMRIATTASPVSGADVRERIEALRQRARIQNALRVIESAWCKYQQREVKRWKKQKSQATVLDKRGDIVEPPYAATRRQTAPARFVKTSSRGSVSFGNREITPSAIESFIMNSDILPSHAITHTAPEARGGHQNIGAVPKRRNGGGAPLSLANLLLRNEGASLEFNDAAQGSPSLGRPGSACEEEVDAKKDA